MRRFCFVVPLPIVLLCVSVLLVDAVDAVVADDGSMALDGSLQPSLGWLNGGTLVTFALRNWPGTDPVMCHWDDKVRAATAVGKQFQCISPAVDAPKHASFWVSSGVNSTQPVTYIFYPVYDLLPGSVPLQVMQTDESVVFFPSVNGTLQPLPAFADPAAACVFSVGGVEFARTAAQVVTTSALSCRTPVASFAHFTLGTLAFSLNGQDLSHPCNVTFFNEPNITGVDPGYVEYWQSFPVTVHTAPNSMFNPGTNGRLLWYYRPAVEFATPLQWIDAQTAQAVAPVASFDTTGVNSVVLFVSLDGGATYSRGGYRVPLQFPCTMLRDSCTVCTQARLDGTRCGWCEQFSLCLNGTAQSTCFGPLGTQPLVYSGSECGAPPAPPTVPLSVWVGLAAAGLIMAVGGVVALVQAFCPARARQGTPGSLPAVV